MTRMLPKFVHSKRIMDDRKRAINIIRRHSPDESAKVRRFSAVLRSAWIPTRHITSLRSSKSQVFTYLVPTLIRESLSLQQRKTGITPESSLPGSRHLWFCETLPGKEAAKVMDAIRKLELRKIHRWLKWMGDQDRYSVQLHCRLDSIPTQLRWLKKGKKT
ncbi:hypothetical protein BJY00DRAFT_119973 [Aspergillus carlsbadensis]|nr:hypothetical protein BJY00DRAFT_119973 [Aspergillus carlsbadensis]